MNEGRRGFGFGLAAYSLWGLFPLYWPLLEPAGAVELLAHRVTWSAAVMVVLVLALRRVGHLRRALSTWRGRLLMLAAAALISTNWGLYIWGVNNGHVIETSLGYFINPLITVLLGVVALKERLRRAQWAALAIAGAAVLLLTVDYGRPPWIALALAFSFGSYGLIKKTAGVGAVEGLTVETLLVLPVAVGYLTWLALGSAGGSLTGHGPGHVALIMSSGVVTAVPLLCFGAAASRIPLSTLGLLQYVTPTLQFLLGFLLYGEPMPHTRWIGFTLIWCSLAVFTVDSLRHQRLRHQQRLLRLELESSAL